MTPYQARAAAWGRCWELIFLTVFQSESDVPLGLDIIGTFHPLPQKWTCLGSVIRWHLLENGSSLDYLTILSGSCLFFPQSLSLATNFLSAMCWFSMAVRTSNLVFEITQSYYFAVL